MFPITTLLKQAKLSGNDKDRGAFFNACYEHFFPKFYLTFKGYFPQDADDLMQDFFLKLMLKDLELFPDEDDTHLFYYMLKMARNFTFDYNRSVDRHRRRFDFVENMSQFTTSWHQINTLDAEMDIQYFKSQLIETQREVISLRLEGYSYKEIAKKLDISETAAKNRVFRARQRFRDEEGNYRKQR